MLEHQHTPPEEMTTLLPPASNVPVTLPGQAQAILVGYLAQTRSENGDVEAVRTHLEELTTAFLELDSTPQDAAHFAIQQWEAERQVMEKQQVLSRKQKVSVVGRSALPPTLTALKVFGAGALALTLITPFLIGTSALSFWYFLMMFLIFGLPALLGIVVGMRDRQRPTLGTFYALALLAPLVAIVSEVAVDIISPFPQHGAVLGLYLLMFWLPIGALTAGLTGWSRDLHRKRRQNRRNRIASTPKAEMATP